MEAKEGDTTCHAPAEVPEVQATPSDVLSRPPSAPAKASEDLPVESVPHDDKGRTEHSSGLDKVATASGGEPTTSYYDNPPPQMWHAAGPPGMKSARHMMMGHPQMLGPPAQVMMMPPHAVGGAQAMSQAALLGAPHIMMGPHGNVPMYPVVGPAMHSHSPSLMQFQVNELFSQPCHPRSLGCNPSLPLPRDA